MLEFALLSDVHLAAVVQQQQVPSPALIRQIADRGPVTARSLLSLTLAMKTARPGATIVLAPGSYGQVSLSDLSFDAPVTLIAKDVELSGLVLNKVSGLRIVGVTVAIEDPTAGGRLAINDSRNIRISEMSARGLPRGQGLFLIRSSNIRVDKSRFEGFRNGVAHSGCYDVAIEGNTFLRLGSDGVTGAGTSRLLIKDNDFADFAPTPGAHPDAIQIFTKGTTSSAEDISIIGNRIRRGSGGIPQGIFITDQVGTLPYRRVVIRDNIIEGAMHNGIAVSHAEDVEVSGNSVQPYDDMNSRINITRVTRGQAFNNRYWKLVPTDNQGVVVRDKPSLSPKRAPAAPP